jgi:hypothetical protein
MYDEKMRENFNEIKNTMKKIGDFEFLYDTFSYGDIKIRKLCRRLICLLDKQKTMVDLKKEKSRQRWRK